MPKAKLFPFMILLFCMFPAVLTARDIAPFVSADWVDSNAKALGALLIDIRSAAEYKNGHIPGSFHAGLDSCDQKPITGDSSQPSPGERQGAIHASATASKKYVLSRIGKSIILDSRIPEVYFGLTMESWAQKPGHIQGAVNLPTPWAFSKDGFLRNQGELESMVQAVIGAGKKSKEIIVYCGVGPYANVWSFILTEMLGYKDVRVYDGSMQEWVMDPVGPISLYGWK